MLPFYFINKVPLLKQKLSKMYLDRAAQIVPKISPYISKEDQILDIGCGTGAISKTIKARINPDITLVDVGYNQMCDLYPVIIYDGVELPFKNKEFNTSLLIAVLHHTKDHDRLLDEAIRVTEDKMIVMEDIFTDLPSRIITLIGDCLVNFEIHSPFQNHSRKDWEEIFKRRSLEILEVKEFKLRCIGFPFRLAIFILQVPGKNTNESKKVRR